MSLAPIAMFSDPMEDYPGYWAQAYQQGTTTKITLATDSTGATTVARAELSSGGTVPIGFLKTAGDVIFVPYVDEAYDLWIFPTEQEAIDDDTSNAIQLADDMSFLQNLANSFGVAKSLDTKVDLVATTDLLEGQIIVMEGYTAINDGGGSRFEMVGAGTGTEDGGEFINAPNNTPALQARNLFPGGRRSVDHWGTTASGDVATEFQAALTYLLANGGELVADGEKEYQIDSLITLINTQPNAGDALPYVIDFKGAVLDFGSSGLTSGSFFSAGSDSSTNIEGATSFNVRNFKIKGTETVTPTGNSASTTTIGLDITFAQNVILENVFVEKCFEGIRSEFSFPLSSNQCDGSLCFVPLHLVGASNDQIWNKFQATNTRFGPVIDESANAFKIVGVTFIAPRIEGADTGFQFDTGPASTDRIRDITIINPYFASITSDFIRIGTSYLKDSPLSRGTTRSSHLNGFVCTGGNWSNGGAWSATKAAIFAGSMTWRAAHVVLPAIESGDSVPNPPLGSKITFIGSVHDITTDHDTLTYDNEGNIVSRLDKNGQQYTVATFVDGDTTPDVTQGNLFKTNNTTAKTITAFDGLGSAGKIFEIIFGDANTTIDFGGVATLIGNNGVDYKGRLNDKMQITYDGTNFICEIVHTGNTAATRVISAGAISVNPGNITVDTEASAATDILTTINGLNFGEKAMLSANDNGRTVTVEHGTGNIVLDGAVDFDLDNITDRIEVQWNGTFNVEISRSNNGA